MRGPYDEECIRGAAAFIAEATVAKRILDHLRLDSRGPPLTRAQAPPDALDPVPSHDGTDPVFPD